MKWIRVLALSLSLWGWGYGVAIAAQPSLGSSFRQWCLQRSSLPAETRKTVEVLLIEAGTSDCEKADEILSSLTELNLNRNQITDVSPLSGLTNLRRLNLKNNPAAQPTCPVSPPNVCSF
ncbi:MAG: leucine-rich repeat domain-containing protein [Coleofasciculus sp. C2-GNP5-27]